MTNKTLPQNPPHTDDAATLPRVVQVVKLGLGGTPASNDCAPPVTEAPVTAQTGSTEIEGALASYPEGLTTDALAALLERPAAKVKAQAALLTAQRRLHVILEGGRRNGAKLWRLGPAPAARPTTGDEPAVRPEPASKPRSAHDVPPLLVADVVRHAHELQRASGRATVAKVFGVLTEEAVEQRFAEAGLRLTLIRTVHGDWFAAFPGPPGNQRSRTYRAIAEKQLSTISSNDLGLPRDLWSPTDVDKDGLPLKKKQAQIISEISTLAPGGWCYDSRIEASHLDARGEFRLKVWERLKIKGEFDPEVDGYLQTFGEEQHHIICDHIVHSVETDRPSPALVLAGCHSGGKDLIAAGEAGLFNIDATFGEGSLALGTFNTSIAKGPIVVCSEGLPVDFRGEPISSSRIKDIISKERHTINAKYQRPADLYGLLRWIVLVNEETDDFYKTKEVMSELDIEAFCRRFVVISVPQKSADYLQALGGWDYTGERWITGERRMVKHFAWILENHTIPPERADSRFGLKSRADGLRRRLLLNSPASGTIVSGVVGFLAGDKDRRGLSDAILAGDGTVAINAATIAKLWNRLGSGIATLKQAPQERVIASEIQRIAIRGAEPIAARGLSFVPLKLDLILGHARAMGLAVDDIQERIKEPRK